MGKLNRKIKAVMTGSSAILVFKGAPLNPAIPGQIKLKLSRSLYN